MTKKTKRNHTIKLGTKGFAKTMLKIKYNLKMANLAAPIAAAAIILGGWGGLNGLSAQTAQGVSKIDQKKHNFYSADTKAAKSFMADFTEAELEQVLNEYKQGKTLAEQRTLWLIGELEARKADRVAADRLLYVFLALTLTGALILFFIFRIFSMQKRIERQNQ